MHDLCCKVKEKFVQSAGMLRCLKIIAIIVLLPSFALAEDVYQKPQDFIREAFGGKAPSPQVMVVDDALQKKIHTVMARRYSLPRVRYWANKNQSAWVLEEIGKTLPITVGIVVEGGAISHLKVLIYRESHGWEVKHDFFTDQFKGAELKYEKKLNQNVDGISGATLSVSALKRLAALALLLDEARKGKANG